MCTYRYARLDYGAYLRTHVLTALKLHRSGTSFLHDPSGIDNRVIHACLIGHKWHICDNKSILCAPCHRCTVMYHIINSYRDCVLISEDSVAQGISNKNSVDS